MRRTLGIGVAALCLATALAGCNGSSGATDDRSFSPSASASPATSASAASSATNSVAPSSPAPASSGASGGTTGSSEVTSPAASVPASVAASVSPAVATSIAVSLAKVTQPIAGGDGGMATIQRPTTHGLAAAVDTALRVPATTALTQFQHDLKANPCSGPSCTPADFLATFAVSRSDTAIVSGTWTILTFYPGAAHPETVLVGITVRASDGSAIAPAQLFTGDELGPLVTPVRAATEAYLAKIGCSDFGTAEFDAATAGTVDNYQGVAVTASGLLVGISEDQVTAHACGSVELPISWSAMRAGLSPLGLAVAAKTALPAAQTAADRCSTGLLEVSLGAQQQLSVGQFQVAVVFTNVAGDPCWLQGFPGVDLTGDTGDGSHTISLVRTPATPQRVTIAPGGSAHAELTYLVGPDVCDAGGAAWTPGDAIVTPPDETVSVSVFWSLNSVDDCQTGATHPGSYIGPILAGA